MRWRNLAASNPEAMAGEARFLGWDRPLEALLPERAAISVGGAQQFTREAINRFKGK